MTNIRWRVRWFVASDVSYLVQAEEAIIGHVAEKVECRTLCLGRDGRSTQASGFDVVVTNLNPCVAWRVGSGLLLIGGNRYAGSADRDRVILRLHLYLGISLLASSSRSTTSVSRAIECAWDMIISASHRDITVAHKLVIQAKELRNKLLDKALHLLPIAADKGVLAVEVGEDEVVGIAEEVGILEVKLQLVSRADRRHQTTVDLLATEGFDLSHKSLRGDIPLVSDLERHALVIQSLIEVPRVDLTPHLVPISLGIENGKIKIHVSDKIKYHPQGYTVC